MPPLSSLSRSRRLKSIGLLAGLVVLLGLLAPGGQAASRGRTRTYYIVADEVRWDYAPLGLNNITGRPFGAAENVFVQQGPDRIGKVYIKALYREYTDASFTHPKPRPPKWQHLGLLGPVIQAEVGDTIVVWFKNRTRFAMSLHPHGVFYRKNSEGAGYNDGTSGRARADDAVPPGGRVRQVWQVPTRSGPGPNDPSSVLWMYHSHVDESGDTNAGLVGPIIITAKGKARPDGSPKDVDRQFVTLFTVFDENRSPYLDLNIRTFAGDPGKVDPDDEEFHESNLMHSINGYVYGNLPGLGMRLGERVRWYPFAMGTEVDLHTPHWHANTLLWNGNRVDLVETLPASLKMLDMEPDNPGTWLYHCHVNDHIDAGMAALYTIRS
jgi:manganese oxidase